ncbi:hypothetical protein ANANG_G00312860 [Anguilla anguilla]|uniref:Uncharacterized protein n=1 Tax=Anguilla anguilla TaxID=7936 RepID=A0A9D3LHC2_ANGAN|nr:hypothetical protein ANANG_G00312860 [Anguilla anguilla]
MGVLTNVSVSWQCHFRRQNKGKNKLIDLVSVIPAFIPKFLVFSKFEMLAFVCMKASSLQPPPSFWEGCRQPQAPYWNLPERTLLPAATVFHSAVHWLSSRSR